MSLLGIQPNRNLNATQFAFGFTFLSNQWKSKMKTVKAIIVLIFVSSIDIFPQSFSFGIGSGISFLQGNTFYTKDIGLAGYYPVNGDYANFLGMNFSTEYNFNGIVSYSFDEIPLSIYSQVSYIIMRGNGNAELSPDVTQPNIPQENYDITTKMNVLTISLGSKYIFSSWNIKPIVILEAQLNNFSDITFEAKNNNKEAKYLSTKGIQRIGIAAGLGLNYNLFSSFDIELIAKYNEFSLFNKRDGEDNLSAIGVNLIFIYSIN